MKNRPTPKRVHIYTDYWIAEDDVEVIDHRAKPDPEFDRLEERAIGWRRAVASREAYKESLTAALQILAVGGAEPEGDFFDLWDRVHRTMNPRNPE